MASEQVYGVTPPISTNLPTEAEKRASDALIEELRRQKTFESPLETDKRHVQAWIVAAARLVIPPPLADWLRHPDTRSLIRFKRFATNSSEK